MLDDDRLEREVQRIGADILRRVESARPNDFAARMAVDPLARWTKRGSAFLADVFRFIDVYPALTSDEQILEYLAAYLGEARGFLSPEEGARVSADAVHALVSDLKGRFTAGETVEEALAVCQTLRERKLGFTLDILGEAVTSETEAEAYANAYIELFRAASPVVAGWSPCALLDESALGAVPRLNVSTKLSSLYSRFDAIDQQGSLEGVASRMRAVLRAAGNHNASVNVDMEQFAIKDLTLDAFKTVLMEDEFRDWTDVSITVQTYLEDGLSDLKALASRVARRGTPVAVRVVKGTYWDHEVHHAEYRNWPVPVYRNKERTDADFEAATRFVLEHYEQCRPAIASHNVRSVAHALATQEALGLARDSVEYQTLYGLGDELSSALAALGCRVRVYVPFGELVPGMAYIVRRLLEATSRSAFLGRMAASPLSPGSGRSLS